MEEENDDLIEKLKKQIEELKQSLRTVKIDGVNMTGEEIEGDIDVIRLNKQLELLQKKELELKLSEWSFVGMINLN